MNTVMIKSERIENDRIYGIKTSDYFKISNSDSPLKEKVREFDYIHYTGILLKRTGVNSFDVFKMSDQDHEVMDYLLLCCPCQK
jgi:hypothetical protein